MILEWNPASMYRRSHSVCVIGGVIILPSAEYESYTCISNNARVNNPFEFVTPDCTFFCAFPCMCLELDI